MKSRKILASLLAVCMVLSAIVVSPVIKAGPGPEKEEMNVLLIGNSYAADTVNYLAEIYESAGYTDFNIVSLYYSGATLSRIYLEMILSEVATETNFNGRDDTTKVFYAGNNGKSLKVDFMKSESDSDKVEGDRSTGGSSFKYQKYTKTNGEAIKAHQPVLNYDLGEAIREDDWDVVTIQNINNSYTADDAAAYTVLKAGTDATYGDYSHKITWNNGTYYGGKEYIGKDIVSVLCDYIVEENSAAQYGNVPKIYFNSTWVPDITQYNGPNRNGGVKAHQPRAVGTSYGNYTLNQASYFWETELKTFVYDKYVGESASVENKIVARIPQNTLVELLNENLPMISNTYSIYRDDVHLNDIARYAVALNLSLIHI